MFKSGDKVLYKGEERGIVKSVKDNEFVWVTYKCGDDWDNYPKYTGILTSISDLTAGWEVPKFINRLTIKDKFPSYEVIEDEDGDFVRYEDIKSIIESLRAAIKLSEYNHPKLLEGQLKSAAVELKKFKNL